KNLVNEAAMRAAREKRQTVIFEDFDQARDKIIMGSVRTLAIQPDEHHRLAVHEAGHAIAAHFLENADPLYKVTIIPRGQALGVTHQLPKYERHTLSKAYLCDRLAIMMGGRVAEKRLLDSYSSGADDDIRQATSLARAMVTRWGMSDDIGPMDLRASDEHPFLGREIAQPKNHSEATAQLVDQAVKALLQDAERRVGEVIDKYQDRLLALISELEAKETLQQEDLMRILGEPVMAPKLVSAGKQVTAASMPG
ncbi:MAG: cell division protein FtsH, partial [Gammaproteobacteria bacterium]|nr:cell division protein FtsH [Gammaproteobacteria bacterium]